MDESSEEWSMAIGHYITSFSFIEKLVYEFIELLPPESFYKHVRSLKDFRDRARFLQVSALAVGWDEGENIVRSLEEAIGLSKIRNNLAHNPIYLDLLMDDEGNIKIGSPKIIKAKSGGHISEVTFEYISKSSGKVQKCAGDLLRSLEAIKNA
jgi:hypothetical protein